MTDHLTDTNVFSEVFKGNAAVKSYIEALDNSLNTTVYVECLQGSKSKREKRTIKKYLSRFPVFYHTPHISRLTISLIDDYSSSHGLTLPDAQIAAVCLLNGLVLVIYNVADFKFIDGLSLVRPKL